MERHGLRTTRTRFHLTSGASVLALAIMAGLAAAPKAHAQSPAPPAAAEPAAAVSEVVVTGTRVQRSGFTAPTPTTVVGAEEIQKQAPVNIADYVNELPQASGTDTPRTNNNSQSTPVTGLNLINLRGLGSNRTLVMLDSQRVVPSTTTGGVDVNNLPTALVARVDVVTGGASAAYGSDAVAGVVNFILDKNFTGIKGMVSGGVTSRGDDHTWNAELSYGTPFAGGRGHILASGQYGFVEGIDYLDPSDRKWFQSCDLLVFATSTPQRLTRCNVNTSKVAQGGVITSTVLANTTFGANGDVLPFVVGSPATSVFMVGGNEWHEGNWVSLDPRLQRYALFGRVSYDLTDDITASFDASWGHSHAISRSAWARWPGTGTTALLMNINNPFIPASVAARGKAAGVTTFQMGYSGWDYGQPSGDSTRDTYRVVGSLDGKLGDWKWNAYYQYGKAILDHALRNSVLNANFKNAIDAVRNSSGQIVCRSTLTNPNDGCVPFNVFGVGVNSAAAVDYVTADSTLHQVTTQSVLSASITGEPFNTWAGPVSVATGAEYRRETINGTSDALSQANSFFTGNFKPTVGTISVKEAFAETVVPLLKDAPFAQNLEFNGAVRFTDYNLAGQVTTWKAGLSWTPFSDLRLRGVRSRDIRAPNFGEVFLAGQTQRQDVFDSTLPTRPFGQITRITEGNTDLKPEIADTTSFGLVYRPSWFPRLSGSIDYFDIDISGAITTLLSQDIVDRCARGETSLCALLGRDASGVLISVRGVPVNVAKQKTRGVDYELTYRQEVGPGALTLRALATNTLDAYTINNNVKTDILGAYLGDGVPKWRYLFTANYDVNRWSLTASARGISAGVYDNTWRSGIEIDDNHVKGATYVDLAGTYKIRDDADGRQLVAFFKIENLLDRDPSLVAGTGISSLQTNRGLFDVIGRNFRIGIRFRE